MKTDIAVAIVVAVGIIVGAFIISTNKEQQIDPATSLKFRIEFNLGCTKDGRTYADCDCMYDEIVNQIGERELLKEAIYYNQTGEFSDPMSDVLVDVVIACY